MSEPLACFQVQQNLKQLVKKHSGEEAAVDVLLLGITGWSQLDLLRNLRQPLANSLVQQLTALVAKYLAGWPVQYLLKKAVFFGHDFYVDPAVLIPRFETEELVEWILQDFGNCQNLRVADIGTGSGAIGISLKLAKPNWQVLLTDISNEALQVAQKNATALRAAVKLLQGDLFRPLSGRYDLLVANPPYIAQSEKKLMDQSVILHEPHQALFASENGLYFYRQMAKQAAGFLKKDGCLFLEIGFNQGKAVTNIFLKNFPHVKVKVKKDISGKDRMIRVSYMEE
jgi:release factor glutamine methyltransferase